MKKLIIIILLLTSCGKSKQAIESFPRQQENVICELQSNTDSLVSLTGQATIAPKSNKELRNERVKIRQNGRTDRRKSKDARKNHRQDVKLAIVEAKQETKRFKSDNNTFIDSIKQTNKGAKIQKQIIKQANKIESKKETFWIVFLIVIAIVVIIIFFVWIYYRKR